jgi:uncharacterized protein
MDIKLDKIKIIAAATEFVRKELEKDSSGHDWWHIWRVTQCAKVIAREEKADEFICELAALLHDIADEKLNINESVGLQKVSNWLETNDVDQTSISQIMEIISSMSFKGGGQSPMQTLEGKVVQDADRLDALGAVGIARTFAYSGAKGQLMHDPTLLPRGEMSAKEYRQGKSTGVNHFYEKLLKLNDLMNTNYAKQLAAERHAYMVEYLKRFLLEWDGKM